MANGAQRRIFNERVKEKAGGGGGRSPREGREQQLPLSMQAAASQRGVAPAAPSACPESDFVEPTAGWYPNSVKTVLIPSSSFRSPTGVEVPCVFT